ncbi:hypothetical protein DRJ25_03975 [Candidatus Woesearchaeota archaeon]|nr:MAG: hypothetical protein DRJ25_03975 [Candidatus Woesearchaeota archaeon]
MSKDDVISRINQIAEMDERELVEFERKILLSAVNPKAKFFLLKAVDERYEQVKRRAGDAMVKESDDISLD